MVQMKHILLAVLAILSFCDGAKILVVFPFPSRSHSILGDGVTRLLLGDGHEVTYLTTHPKKNPPPNLHQVDISDNLKLLSGNAAGNLSKLIDKSQSKHDFKAFLTLLTDLCRETLNNKNTQRMFNDDSQKFDLVIIEWLFGDAFSGLAAVYDCPYIWVSSVDPHWLVLDLIDEGLNPAYNGDSLSNNIPPFTFTQRVQELFNQIFFYCFRLFYLLPAERVEYEKVFAPIMARKGKPLPSFDEVRYNASLMLGNSHVSIGKPIRLPQNYKPVGGYHIDPDVQPLPEDLKKIMDEAKNGVIYFSLGSNLKSRDLPDSVKRELLDLFGELKSVVIWKFEETLADVPNNVHIMKWAPQPSILSHPNTVLFITHGGLLSTTETVHFGVPIIGIPVIADQATNVLKAVRTGYALMVDLSFDLAKDLKEAIREMLGNQKYTQKVKELSLIYHDRPTPPGKELVHWVNHVIRTNGSPHLRSPALMVPWYQKMYLDLLALVIASLYILKWAVKKVCCRWKPIANVQNKKSKSKKNN